MSYLHIDNLYKNQDILLFRECYALEKIHGTSAHVAWNRAAPLDDMLRFFSGGESHERFVGLFDQATLVAKFDALGHAAVTVYGEAYGGRQQGMSTTYGKELRFIAFDVKVGDVWLAVPDMDQLVKGLGLEVAPWEKVSTDLAAIDAQRDRDSVVAERNGVGPGKAREGVVLRPPIEVVKNNGERIIAKHKRADFEERATPPRVVDQALLQKLADADAIAQEWVTEMRLSHVLDKLGAGGVAVGIERTGDVMKAMVEDVAREAAGEIADSKDARKAIGARAAKIFKARVTRVPG